jgi:hypothetical protein
MLKGMKQIDLPRGLSALLEIVPKDLKDEIGLLADRFEKLLTAQTLTPQAA